MVNFVHRMYSKKWLPLHVAATWICGFVFLVPPSLSIWGQFGLDLTIGSCTIILDKNGRSSKEFLFVFAFLSPCLAIIVCYARWVRIWMNIWNNKLKWHRRQKSSILSMAGLLTGKFPSLFGQLISSLL